MQHTLHATGWRPPRGGESRAGVRLSSARVPTASVRNGAATPLPKVRLHADAMEDEAFCPVPDYIRNQGSELLCCVSAAIVTAMESLYLTANAPIRLSMLFHYAVARHDLDEISTLSVSGGLGRLGRLGVSRHELHPDPELHEGIREPIDISAIPETTWAGLEPTDSARRDARSRRLPMSRRGGRLAFFPVGSDIDAWRALLQSQRPIVIAFKQSTGYQEVLEGAHRHGTFVSTLTSEVGHAVLVFGYSEAARAFKVRDSRGSEIGDNGEWWLPSALASDNSFISEAAYIEELPH